LAAQGYRCYQQYCQQQNAASIEELHETPHDDESYSASTNYTFVSRILPLIIAQCYQEAEMRNIMARLIAVSARLLMQWY
jgi:uncharacterized membrane protein YebE (DUF533 family)